MKAVQFDRYGPADVLAVHEVPRPVCAPEEVLVRVAAASVNPKDTFMRKGRFRRYTGERFPQTPGFDFAGTVECAGSSVRDLAPGERVWSMINGWRGGACAEYVTVAARHCGRVPAGLDEVEAAGIPLAGLTALQALRDHGRLRAGMRVCINGASGGVGVHALQIAKAAGAHVTALCSTRSASLCRELGAEVLIDYTQHPLHTLQGPFDIVFDVFGNSSYLRARPLLAPRGRYVTTVPNPVNLRWHVLTRYWPGRQGRLVIVAASRSDLDVLSGMVLAGTLRPVVDRVYRLEEVREAHRHVETKHTHGKVIVRLHDV